MPAAASSTRHSLACALWVALYLSVGAVHAQLKDIPHRLGITMVSIPAGRFVMGSCKTHTPTQAPAADHQTPAFLGQALLQAPQTTPCLLGSPDPDAYNNETPQRHVQVSAFQIGKTEVTLGQFKQFLAATGRFDLVNDDFIRHNAQGDNAAVTNVSWYDAQDFIAWLNQTEGKNWRLPTEAEWEYACRGGGRHTYCGNDDINRIAWFDHNSGGHVHPVATKAPNAFGLHDMSGNVYEWVQDVWHGSYLEAPHNGGAWITGGHEDIRVLRGGSWNFNARLSRVTHRNFNSPINRNFNVGFRVARTIP